jgi:hypothetical protein
VSREETRSHHLDIELLLLYFEYIRFDERYMSLAEVHTLCRDLELVGLEVELPALVPGKQLLCVFF